MKGAHRQAHARANGRWAIYWYAWRGGPQIAAYVGATRAEAEALEEAGWRDLAVEWANATRTTPATGLVARVVAEYRAHDSYKALKHATRATYTVWLDRIVDEFGALTEREVTDERWSLFNTTRWNDPEKPPIPACCHVVPILLAAARLFDRNRVS